MERKSHMKIYVITKGEYSDHHICAVSEDERKAEMLRRFYSGDGRYEEATIEEYDTNLWLTEIESGFKMYCCRVDDDGIIEIVESALTLDYTSPGDFKVRYYEKQHRYCLYVFAKDKDHAKKIAIDKVNEYKAIKEGII